MGVLQVSFQLEGSASPLSSMYAAGAGAAAAAAAGESVVSRVTLVTREEGQLEEVGGKQGPSAKPSRDSPRPVQRKERKESGLVWRDRKTAECTCTCTIGTSEGMLLQQALACHFQHA